MQPSIKFMQTHFLFQVSTVARARIAALQKRWLQPQIVLLDVGMATEMTEEDQVNMVSRIRVRDHPCQ